MASMNRFYRVGALCCGWVGVLALSACSPALNWRSVAVPQAGLSLTLPCKPDHAQRTVELAGQPTALHMLGCEADGALFAFSHTVWADAGQADAALGHWRTGMLSALGAGAAARAVDKPYRAAGVLPLSQSVHTIVQGHKPDGTALTADGLWFARSVAGQMHLYHAVVYTPRPRPELAAQFFASWTAQ